MSTPRYATNTEVSSERSRMRTLARYGSTLLLLLFSAQANATCFDIPPSDLRDALNHLAVKSNTPMIFDLNIAGSYHSSGARGCMSDLQALEQILNESTLTYFIYDGVVMLKLVGPCRPELGAKAPLPPCLPPSLKGMTSQ